VLVPGDPEYRAVAQRSRDGIPLTRSVFEDIRGIARAAGVPFVLDAAR
jgi:LDH2 family malate/lactate/ureidoglycolate dehydrogenase